MFCSAWAKLGSSTLCDSYQLYHIQIYTYICYVIYYINIHQRGRNVLFLVNQIYIYPNPAVIHLMPRWCHHMLVSSCGLWAELEIADKFQICSMQGGYTEPELENKMASIHTLLQFVSPWVAGIYLYKSTDHRTDVKWSILSVDRFKEFEYYSGRSFGTEINRSIQVSGRSVEVVGQRGITVHSKTVLNQPTNGPFKFGLRSQYIKIMVLYGRSFGTQRID